MNISRREKRRISKSARDFASSVRIFVSREIVLIRTIYIYIYVYIRPSVRRNLSIVSKKRSRKFDRRENRRETSSDTIGLGVHRRVLCFSSGFSRSKIEKKRKPPETPRFLEASSSTHDIVQLLSMTLLWPKYFYLSRFSFLLPLLPPLLLGPSRYDDVLLRATSSYRSLFVLSRR